MSEFTAEDFAQANLATKGKFGVAIRTDPHFARQWRAYGSRQGYFSDEELAADGWTPVVESRVTEHTLRDPQEKAARKREKLIDHIDFVEAALRDRNEQIKLQNAKLGAAEARIKELLARCASLEDDCSHLIEERESPLSLDTLEAVWESAEQADECRKGDVLIERYPNRSWHVYQAESMLSVCRDVRILSRAPQREPWADLADALRGTVWERLSGDVDGLAAAVHAAGWRKGGDDDE